MKKTSIFLITVFAVTMMANSQPPIYHPVIKGESVWEISKTYQNFGGPWDKISKDNNLIIKSGPNPNWYYPLIKPGDVLKIYPLDPALEPQSKPAKSILINPVPSTVSDDYWWMNFDPFTLLLLLIIIILLIALVVRIVNFNKAEQEAKEKNNRLSGEKNELENLAKRLRIENEELRNKLPVEAPEIADEEWLKNNFSVGNSIAEDNPELASNAITRVYGKKPDLIAQAKVSTAANSVSMEFSNDRKATTGLKDVVVYLGWNWNGKKNIWDEVGMLAGPCSNGFEANPDNVVKDQLFTKVELVDLKRHPVLFTGENVPARTKYPLLVKSLVIKYHGGNITEIMKAGAGVIIPKNLK